ncbi:hypothetical protein EVAR_20140_1 [Eumeta japonica]|uniref:Uncharacterized protein n=1 Tax=Eumeta variegata TaxID=151549 RepID=A0A4C1V342_EUMVA|nr:hypothetical protein EVAR_20140_1 [Eumeta japonica]
MREERTSRPVLHEHVARAALPQMPSRPAPRLPFDPLWLYKQSLAPREFKRGRVYLRGEFRGGRPSTAENNKNIDAVRRTIESDRHVTYHETRASLGIGVPLRALIRQPNGNYCKVLLEAERGAVALYCCLQIVTTRIELIVRRSEERSSTTTTEVSSKFLFGSGWRYPSTLFFPPQNLNARPTSSFLLPYPFYSLRNSQIE